MLSNYAASEGPPRYPLGNPWCCRSGLLGCRRSRGRIRRVSVMAMRRAIVRLLATADEAIDSLADRPAIVKATLNFPRWWMCDASRLSLALEERRSTDCWDPLDWRPGIPCEVCHRRPSIFEYGDNKAPTGIDEPSAWPIRTCGWCLLSGKMSTPSEIQDEIMRARSLSISWRWRLPIAADE